MELRIYLGRPSKKAAKRLLIGLAILLMAAGVYVWLQNRDTSTIPRNLRQQANFPTVYPTAKLTAADTPDFQFNADKKVLIFKIKQDGIDFAVTEQAAPATLSNDSQIYFQSLGLHPIAEFKSKSGSVAILNFYQAGNLKAQGQSGMLVTGKTLVIVNSVDPNKKPTYDQWKAVFDNLVLSR